MSGLNAGFPLVLEIGKRVWNLIKMLKGLERVWNLMKIARFLSKIGENDKNVMKNQLFIVAALHSLIILEKQLVERGSFYP